MNRNDKIKEAFDQVHVENTLKDKTKDFIFQKTKGYKQTRFINYRYLISALVCIVFLFVGGQWLYFTPTVEISIDINPSIELGVNRFNHIISIEGYNDDGKTLIDSLDIKYMNYDEALNQIIKSEDIVSLLSDDEIMTITIVGADSIQSEEILSYVQSCTSQEQNTYCFYAHSKEVEPAHEVGLSYGKYKAFLELQKLDSSITIDQIQNMTMHEIREKIYELTNSGENVESSLKNEHNEHHRHRKSSSSNQKSDNQ